MATNIRLVKSYIWGFIDSHIVSYPSPSNFTYMWSFGSLAGLCLVIQIITGIFLAMHYTPEISLAFESVEHIMRDVNYGWLIRYIHANGASMFFIVVYTHMFRGIFYGSFMNPREYLWASGVLIFVLMMATAFLGYVLPWGQMSFWGATVITNLFSAIPVIGGSIVEWLWGGFSVSNATLNRFFSFHYLLPFLIVAAVLLHLSLLHHVGSNNPLGMNTGTDYISFYPYYSSKDVYAFFLFVFVFSAFVVYIPNFLGHPDNYIVANELSTPAHIVPEWYFLPYYAVLRSIPSKLGGVLAMALAIVVLLFLPVLHNSYTRSGGLRPVFKYIYWFLVSDFLLLGWLGQKPADEPYVTVGFLTTLFYFVFFFAIMPIVGGVERKKMYDIPHFIEIIIFYILFFKYVLISKIIGRNYILQVICYDIYHVLKNDAIFACNYLRKEMSFPFIFKLLPVREGRQNFELETLPENVRPVSFYPIHLFRAIKETAPFKEHVFVDINEGCEGLPSMTEPFFKEFGSVLKKKNPELARIYSNENVSISRVARRRFSKKANLFNSVNKRFFQKR